MTATKARPVHLNLLKIKLPIGGIMSILHRATGIFMFLMVPYLLYLLDLSLTSPQGYAAASASVHSGIGVILILGLMWSLMHHLLAGIRYLAIDVDYGVEKEMARKSARVVVYAAPVLGLILTGILL